MIDDTGDRKDGSATAHVARQYLGLVGKTDNGIVAVTSLWADPRCYWPVHLVPYTPASRLAKGTADPGFRTKPQLAVEPVQAAQQAQIAFRAVVADCAYGDNPGFTQALGAAGVPFVLALKPRKGNWAPADQAHSPVEAAHELGWRGPARPGQWRRIQRRFRDGHTQTWWAADAVLGGWGPQGRHRLVVATTDPERLPAMSTGTCCATWLAPPAAAPSRPSLPRSSGCMGCATGWSRATSRSRVSSAGPTSRSEATGRSAGIGPWCAAPSVSAGMPARPSQAPRRRPHRLRPRRPGRRPAAARRPRGGPSNVSIQTGSLPRAGGGVSWPQALRRVRGWLAPWVWLQRCWRGWSTSPPPRQLQQALEGVGAEDPIYLYLPP